MIYLASLGDEAKIWDVPSFSLLEEFNPYNGSISDITWSHDGYLIASCCSTDQNVHVRLTKAAQSVPSEPITLPSGCQCLDYSSTSRYLLCGCVDGSMHIWDRKLHAMKKSYTNLKHPITVARWNWNDTNICVGLDSGKILLYNTATHQTSNPLVAPSVNAIRQLRYNPYHKSSLVAVSEDGAVNFWDTNTRRLVHAFTKTHQAPARDVVFSPINDYLMVSVGLDKRAVFYDIQNKTPVKTVMAEQPLTSVEMMPDGATIVVGTSRGKVFFYDMRQSSTPIFSFTAHKSSVKHLSFVKKDGETNDSSSQSLRRQLPTTPMLPTDAHNQKSNSSTNYQSPRISTYQSGLEIFSPASNANKSSSSFTEVTSSEKSWMHSNLSKLQTTDIFATGDGVYSPVRQENSLSINNTHNRSSILSNNSFLTQILGPAETANNDPASSQTNNLFTIGEGPVIVGERNSLSRENTEHSPRPQRGMGASPSLQQLSAPRLEDVDSSLLPNRTAPSSQTPTRSSAASAITSSPAQSRVSPEDRPEVLGAASANGGASSQSPPIGHYRVEPGDLSNLLAVKNGTASPSRSPNSFQQRTRTPSEPVAGSSATSSASSVRHMVQDLLKEHFQEHQDQLKTEIRAMLGQPGFNTLGAPQTSHSSSLPSQGNPGIFHAEFIRNLIREELEDVKDFIHKEFWCVQVELIKQVFQLQKRIESGLAECAINPLLLDEIDRLREENARLKKTF